jgi:hypothetical protein
MIQINYLNEVFELRNEPSEIKLHEFEKMYKVINNESVGKIEQYFEVFKILGMPDEIADHVDGDTFLEIIKNFNAIMVTDEQPAAEVEIGGRIYRAYEGDDFKFSGRDLVEIEKLATKGHDNFPSQLLAIIFKDIDLTSNEHRNPAHIKHKAKLFASELTAEVAIPYITRIAKRTLKSLEKANEVE